jgi:hypothetical protein
MWPFLFWSVSAFLAGKGSQGTAASFPALKEKDHEHHLQAVAFVVIILGNIPFQ